VAQLRDLKTPDSGKRIRNPESGVIEERLYRDTWAQSGYDLIPRLRSLRIPTLVMVGEQDFIPLPVCGAPRGR
jgi:pimeloyl-ACP methyl ester carboxylesterase